MSDNSSESEVRPPGPREVLVEEHSDSEDSTIASTSSDEEERREIPKSEIPAEYWHIQKLVKYMKTGNQTATVVALCCLKDHDLKTEINQLAIQDIGGLEVLINLLETKDLKCKLGALTVLTELTENPEIRKCIADLGAIDLLVKNLSDPARDLQILVGETIYNVAQIRKARKQVRKYDGIPKLIDLLDVSEHCLITPWSELSEDDMEFVHIAKAAARALWAVSQSRKNVNVMMKSGSVPLLARLLRSIHIDVVIPTVGTISQCANNPHYQLAIETEGMIKDIVRHLSAAEYPQLRRYCAETIFKCAENPLTRDQVREAGGLDPLVAMARDPKARADKPLLAAVTGAIWKCAISPENVVRLDQLKAVQTLVGIIGNVEEASTVLGNSVGALSECVKFEHNRHILRGSGGIPHLVNLLNFVFPPLLENVPKVLKECAEDDESMRIIEELDGVRLIWSLLKNSNPKVIANAAWSLVPCVRNALDSGEMVRCFVGGLELIVTLLKSTDNLVLGAVCAAISEVAKDKENLGVMSDHGVVPLLVNLVNTKDEMLRENLASAIAYCSTWGSNNKQFGRLGAITPLVSYMASRNPNVHRTTALALYYLSKNPFNCITMHESGVVPFLLKTVGSTDEKLQEASAGCLGNIRRLALEAETYHLITRGEKKEESSDEFD
ncbi:armadillo repeat-containing protein gudu [Photinus pyralis]|nr:armadillo repeat-containing protein gudu [Photinus pyralis]